MWLIKRLSDGWYAGKWDIYTQDPHQARTYSDQEKQQAWTATGEEWVPFPQETSHENSS